MKGRFLAFEGIDGCGKTTQINHLATWLPMSGLMPIGSRLHLTREPGGTALGIALRELLLKPPEDQSPTDLTELLLYAADRAQHVSQMIFPALNAGDWVLTDRFSGSTVAYQGFGRQLDLEVIKQLEVIATQNLNPDLTLWLDIPIEESLSRRGATPNDRIESEGKEFLAKVSLGFAELARDRNWIRISAQLDANEVAKEIQREIKHFLDGYLKEQ